MIAQLALAAIACAAAEKDAPRPLNNLVTELLAGSIPSPGVAKFRNPREGWVFFRSSAILRDGTQGPRTLETMRYLPEGEHTFSVGPGAEGAPVAALTVRAIPEIIYANYPADPHLKEFGVYDGAFLRRIGMLDAANVLITSPDAAGIIDGWVSEGKRLIEQNPVPGLSGPSPTVEGCFARWAESLGMMHPRSSGIIIDEFYPAAADRYPVWIEALAKVAERRPGRTIYPYIAGDPRGLLPFVKPLAASPGFRFAYERYLREQPTEAAARELIERRLRDDVLALASEIPDIRGKLICVLGLLSGPPETLDVDPAVSFKVFMDMQFHTLANDPALRGLYGIEEYLVSYADEEYLRWAAKLYRHYCIEGKTERLTADPYLLPHIRNPDFEQGIEGWTVAAAAPDSVAVKSMEGLGWLQGRWPRGRKGDTFLWTRRDGRKPNVVSQTIRAIEPGRVYSLRMYAGDAADLTREGKHAISVEIRGAEVLCDLCFQAVFPNCYDHHIERYGDRKTYFNFFRQVFRATSATAELTISDWASASDPGGPAGQELLINFVQIQPYLLEGGADPDSRR